MSSLHQILNQCGRVLLLDAASSVTQVALLSRDNGSTWKSSQEEAGIAVFRCMEELQISPQSVDGFIFCEGPGSILGIRTVAAALRTWLSLKKVPVWTYKSLELAYASPQRTGEVVISDARRDSWNLVCDQSGCKRVPTQNLPREVRLAIPAGFKTWGKLPEGLLVGSTPYALAGMMEGITDADLFHPSESPDAFLHEEPSYVTWAPSIHRATS